MADSTPILIPMEDDSLHTTTSPFCYNPTCSCHKQASRIEQIAQAVQEGLFTPEEASAFVAGHNLWAGIGEEVSR